MVQLAVQHSSRQRLPGRRCGYQAAFQQCNLQRTPSGPQHQRLWVPDQLWRFTSNNLVLSFCSLDSVGIISKLTSPDLSDSAHLNTHSFHMSCNLDVTSSMRTVNYTNGQGKSTHFYPQSPVSGANLTSACAEEQSPGSPAQCWLSSSHVHSLVICFSQGPEN